MVSHFNVHYRSLILSCLLFEAGLADVSCQNGIDYNNRCNPYKVQFVTAQSVNKSSKVKLENHESRKKHKWFSRTYLNKLLERYSSNYDGRSGLQALIDRSHYGKAKQEKSEVESSSKKEIQERKELAVSQQERNATVISSVIKGVEGKTLSNISSSSAKEKKETLSTNLTTPSNIPTNSLSIATKSKEAKKSSAVETLTKSKEKTETKVVKKSLTTPTKVVKKKEQPQLASYSVKKGDTLSAISAAIGMPLKKLKSLNKLDKKSKIKVGQTLKVPLHLAKRLKKLEETKAKKAKKIATQKVKEQLKKGYYIVKKGDTLSKIAKLTNLSITQLREYNRIARSKKIKVGQKLLLKENRVARRGSRSLNYLKNIKFKHAPQLKFKRKIRVVATAYTSHRNQTDSTPFLAAWNNRIRPGMKIIAVSVDLIRKYGLTNGVKVKITGLPGYYVVRDKMNKRLRNHIDIYMGVNKRKALRWGRRRVALYW